MLNRVSQNVSGKEAEWVIKKITMQSPVTITLEPVAAAGRKAIPSVLQLEGLEDEGGHLPRGFDRGALQEARKLAALSDNGAVQISYGARKVDFTKRIGKRLEAVSKLISPPFREWTTLTGRLEEISVHGGKSIFRIFLPVQKDPVECRFADDQLERVKESLPSRVQVYGEASFNRDGRPVSIGVADFKRLRSREELPQLRAMPPIKIEKSDE